MTTKYYQTLFPFDTVRRFLSDDPHTIWTQKYQFNNRAGNGSWANFGTLTRGLEHVLKTDELYATALHCKSETHKRFAMDIDLDERHISGCKCSPEHDDGSQRICPRCWSTMIVCAAIIYEALQNIFNYISLKFSYEWKPMLLCFSGNRGMHFYCHPKSGMHTLPENIRIKIVKTVMLNWKNWIGQDLKDYLQKIDFKSRHPGKSLPIDAQASYGCTHNLRCLFSPHIKSIYATTPVMHVTSWQDLARVSGIEDKCAPITIETKGVVWECNACQNPENVARVVESKAILAKWLDL